LSDKVKHTTFSVKEYPVKNSLHMSEQEFLQAVYKNKIKYNWFLRVCLSVV